jgi:hypothetical protein
MIIITTILQLPVQRALTLVHRLILSSSSALALKHVETTGSMEKSHQPKAFRESASSTSVVSSLADHPGYGPSHPIFGPLARSSASCIGIREEERPQKPPVCLRMEDYKKMAIYS